jgi:hypothetical protein
LLDGAHRRWSLQGDAVGTGWRPEDHGVAGAAVPSGVPAAAVPEAGDVADKNLVRPERVSVGASAGRLVIHLPSMARTS